MTFVLPGQRLAATGTPGAGVYANAEGILYAALVGTASVDPGTGVVTVRPHPANAHRSVVPSPDQTIIGTVTKITAKYAAVDIKAIEDPACGKNTIILPEPFRGTIRSQDIWSEEDTRAANSAAAASNATGPAIQVPMAFAPGDLVRAKVMGVGDAQTGFLLSTGLEPRLGVVFAATSNGMGGRTPLVPVAWNAMLCSVTGKRVPRKCALPSKQ